MTADVYNIYDKNGVLLDKHAKVNIRTQRGFYANFIVNGKEYYITNFYTKKRDLHVLTDD